MQAGMVLTIEPGIYFNWPVSYTYLEYALCIFAIWQQVIET